MTTTPKPVHFLLLFYVCLKTLVLAQDENQFIYNGFQGANLHLDGLAQILQNGLLQLTNTSQQQSGHAFYQLPIRFNTSSSGLPQTLSFSTNFVFAIVPEIQNTSGCHGIAFTISPSRDLTKAQASEYLGLLNNANNGSPSNHLLAIELDTVKSFSMNDTDGNHVGIDVNSLISNVSEHAAYYSSSEGINKSLELKSGNPIQVWIDYDGVKLNVTLAPIESPKPIQPLLSMRINVSSILLDSMYVGFSSATGVGSCNHYILGWSFNKSGNAQSVEISKLPSLPQQRKSRGKPGLPEERVLIDWVIENWKQGAILETSDPRLRGEYLKEEMELVLKLGLFCSHPNAVRPSMRQVVQYLDGDALFPNDILLDITGIGTLGVRNEASPEFVMSFPSSVLKGFQDSMSSSLLHSGR
ncbi:L-type lectin-domain containing receptor kinase I.8 [Camellia lanceoleosa]|uniref:L-type lectin-domain containing receptor kinase I.8 n=1 Tax=Camellia lanceoleosa TaxID=1840588 RepID=A0ACC0HQX5_9ERIC|nr:L-type lectin-domain containing receptor kinase I.8 [Camellia lanceoleosa]